MKLLLGVLALALLLVPALSPHGASLPIVPSGTPTEEADCDETRVEPGPHDFERRITDSPSYAGYIVETWVGHDDDVASAPVPSHLYSMVATCALWGDYLGCQRDGATFQPGSAQARFCALLGTVGIGNYNPFQVTTVRKGVTIAEQTHDDVICGFNSLGIQKRFNGSPC